MNKKFITAAILTAAAVLGVIFKVRLKNERLKLEEEQEVHNKV